MRRLVQRGAWLIGVAGLLAGCSANVRPPYPPDPLLVSKKPQETKADKSEPLLLAYQEPVPPSAPANALASAPPSYRPAAPVMVRDRGPTTPAATAARPFSLAPGEARLAVQRRSAGDFAHSDDYSWLQGVLDKRHPGEPILRYQDQPRDDPWGGSVRLENDRRLSQFQDGDVIAVEGEPVRDGPGLPPRFHVRAIWLVRPSRTTR